MNRRPRSPQREANSSHRLAPVLSALILTVSGCSATQKVTDTTSQLDQQKQLFDQQKQKVQDEKDKASKKDGDKSGDDDDRLHSKEAAINTPLDDEVNHKKGDKYDWRKFVLLGRPGVATFEIHWDEESANLEIDVYDAYGTNIARSPRKIEGVSVKKILVKISEPGLYYVRVMAPTPKDASIYTVSVKWNGPPGPAAQGAASPGSVAPHAAPLPPPPEAGPPVDPNKIQGKIVSAYRDGADWILYLDKGTADRLRPGLVGIILEGSEGEKALEGGTFTVSQVPDEHKAIARASIKKPLGKNNRIVVNLK